MSLKKENNNKTSDVMIITLQTQKKCKGELTWEEFYKSRGNEWFASAEILNTYKLLFGRYKGKNSVGKSEVFSADMFEKICEKDKLNAWDLIHDTDERGQFDRGDFFVLFVPQIDMQKNT